MRGRKYSSLTLSFSARHFFYILPQRIAGVPVAVSKHLRLRSSFGMVTGTPSIISFRVEFY
jgi:hypothetical protein